MMPGSDGYDSQGGAPQAGIMKGDSLIFCRRHRCHTFAQGVG
ncbi:peptidyl-prolyl cis-trans isomerase [Cutibacterium acnes JCM 18909]|nr:peptidyl-prolyl cis-trans isomerase [Cutibacterium acnes JCM 18909]